jgi:hypothetical protein
MHSLSIHHKLYSWVYFGILIVVILFLYKDYGISWDEPIQRGIGTAAYNYVTHGDRSYLQMYDKIYGVGFELPLVIIEKKLGLEDTRDIFLMRHLMQGLFFAFACFVFFRMNLRLFGSFKIAIIPTLFLLFSPRIFAHGFFNSKDIPFLCMYIISLSALHLYLLKPGYWQLFILGICAGLLINFRIMGVLFFGMAFIALIIYLMEQRKFKFVIHIVLFTSISALVLYSTWPYLWIKPFKNFQNSFLLMSQFHWQGTMLFRGMILHPGEKLTQYLFWWIAISVPVLYLVVCGIGAVLFFWKTIRRPKQMVNNPLKIMGWVFIATAVVPVVAVFYFHSVLYDDWRQLYFIYPSIIIFAGYLFYFMDKWKPKITTFAWLVCSLYILFIGFQMNKLHPYEHVYFNELVPRSKDYILQHYEMDYWGTSFYDGLKYLAKTEESDTIKIFLFSDALRRNAMLLPERDRNRLVFVQNQPDEPNAGRAEVESDYFITNFRYDYVDMVGKSNFQNILYSINRQNSTILRVWKH